MKDVSGKIEYKGTEYQIVFNLNVMQRIQEEYGSIEKWGEITDGGEGGEPDAKAVIFGFTQMLNEGIEISNEDFGTDIKPLTYRQVGRIITEVGLQQATATMNDTVVKSTKGEQKNA